MCYHKTQKKCNCDGQSTYKANIVDEAIENAVRDLLSKIKDRPKESVIKMRYESKMRGLKVKGTELQHIIIEEKNKLE